MSRKPSNATHRKRLRSFTYMGYGAYRHAIDSVPCPVCGSGRYLGCIPDPAVGDCRVHTPRLLLSRLIPMGDSLLLEQTEFIRFFGTPKPVPEPEDKSEAVPPNSLYPKR